jgi:epsilon-lactone hydrolase
MTAHQRDMAEQILRDAPFDLGRDVAVQRPLLEQTLTSQPPPPDVHTTTGDLGGIPVILNKIADVDPGRTIFHIHGGGFALGSAGGSAGLASSLARETGMRTVPADYLPAPEHPYPTPLKDVKAAYRAPVNQTGRADRIVLSVESAGSNLAGLGVDADGDVHPRLVASAAVTTPMLVIDLWLRTRASVGLRPLMSDAFARLAAGFRPPRTGRGAHHSRIRRAKDR